MPSITINGPVVPADVHNVVLRGALFHSPVARLANATSYHVIEIGVRSGAYTTWVGTWDQSEQKVEAGTPTSILAREGMRLQAGRAIVVRVSTYGTPVSLEGSRVNFTLALVGGRDGAAKPLVSAPRPADSDTRTAVAALEKQINEGGLSEWDEPVQLQDPVALAPTGCFQGRIQRDSATQISLQRYSGNWVEVDGEALSITSSGLALTTSDGLLSASGGVTSTAPSSSTLYYVYVGSPSGGSAQLRLCATAPSRYLGTYYLGTDETARRWRFVGWARTNASTQFVDDTTDRLVVNYHNRAWASILLRPAYSDNNAINQHTTTSTTWTAANAGTGATASYVANGEDAIHVVAHSRCASSQGTGVVRIGIGDNSGANAAVACCRVGTTFESIACSYSTIPATGYRTLVLLVSVSGGTGTYHADDARNGSATDPALTALYGRVAA